MKYCRRTIMTFALVIVLFGFLSLQMVGAWHITYLTIAKKDQYGGYDVKFSPIVDTSNATISSDLQKIVEKYCDADKAVAFSISDDSIYVEALYDPNGVLYAKGIWAYTKDGYMPAMPCPDRSRPGYWKVVFSDGTAITFYVSEKTRGFSVQAICGPASIAGLALLPLGILGVKRRRR